MTHGPKWDLLEDDLEMAGCECHSPVITVSTEDPDTMSRFPEVLGQYVFDGELSFSDLSVLGKPVYVRRVGGHTYSMHFNAQLETWWLGDFVGDSTPLLKQAVKAVEVCPADNDQVLTAWSSQHQLVNDDSQTTTTRWVADTPLYIHCW